MGRMGVKTWGSDPGGGCEEARQLEGQGRGKRVKRQRI